jgi:hypothetical protein
MMLTVVLTIVMGAAAAGQDTALEAFSYATDAEAQAHWSPQFGSMPARVVTLEDGSTCLAFDAEFEQEGDRACWDWHAPIDLSDVGRMSFEISATQPAMAKTFGIYFGTEGGWYSDMWYQMTPESWSKEVFLLSEFGTEDAPAGWDNVTKFRFSMWGAKPGKVTYFLRDMRIIPADPGENLIKNGSFEIPGKEVPYGWGSGHWGVGDMPWAGDMDLWRRHWRLDHRRAKHGKASLRIDNTPDLPLLKARSLWKPLPKEGTYVVSAWLKADRNDLPVVIRFAGSETRSTVGKEWERVVLRGDMPIGGGP